MRKVLHFLKWLLAWLNIAVCVWLLAAAWGGCISPKHLGLLMPLGLSLPIALALTLVFLLFWIVVRWKFALISLASLIASAPAIRTYCPLNFPDPHPKGAIFVMSYNVRGFPAQGDDGIDIPDYLLQKDPDILCLQEYGYGPYSEHGKQVTAALKHWPYKEVVYLASENCVAVCSRYPIVKVDTIQRNFYQHGAVAFYLKVDSDTIAVVNGHLVSNGIGPDDYTSIEELQESVSGGNDRTLPGNLLAFLKMVDKVAKRAERRALQVDTIAQYIEQLPEDMPVVFCGDLNDSPNSYAHHRLCKTLNDAYVSSGNGPGISFGTRPFYFRLDNILCSSHWKAYSARVDRRSKRSDHFPISCYLARKKP